MSVITKETTECLNIKPGRRKVKFTGIDGIVKECPTAKITLWLPGEKKLTLTKVLIGAANTNILGFDVLYGRVWKLPDGSLWSFAGQGDGEIAWLEEDETKAINLLEMSIPLPPSRITNVKQYPLPAAAHSGIDGVVTDLEKRGIITRTHSPYNSPIWPVKKPNGQWRLTIDYRRSNANTAPLTAAVPNIAELVTQIEGASHPWMATLDVKDMFFMIPLQEHDKAEFAFTWKGIRYTFNRLPQGYKHSPTIAHSALAKVLSEIPSPQGITIYQYINDILIGGKNSEEVRHTMEGIQEKLITLGLDIPPSKCQGPAQEVKFLGVWWIKGAASVPPDALEKIEHGQNPSSIKELQQVLGSLSYWRKHIPGFSIIARPLYNLLRKGKSWEWTKQHETALELLTRELRLFQQLGPLHPTDPIHVEWGFSEHGSHCNLRQKGPEGPERPLEFSSHSFNDTEMRYSDLEKGLLSLVRAVKKVEQIRKGQSVIIRGPFRLLDIVRKGTAPPAGIAQKPTACEWYAYLESINDIMPITEGSIKVSKLQKDIDSTLLFQTPPSKPSPIQEALPLKEGSDLKGVWFTDASSYRQNNEWNYKAVALEVATGEKLSETAECRPQFAFTWRDVQYTWNRLPQGWKHSPTICHGLIQTALEKGEAPEHLQYIDDIIVWGNSAEEVSEKGKNVVQILLKAGFAIKQSKVKGPLQEIQFLGIKWQDGHRQIPMDVINKIAAMSPPTNKKETQAFLGVVGFWRMHIPNYSLIVSPLYQWARIGNPNHPGILEVITDWPEGKDFGMYPEEEVTHAEESSLYNKLPENEKPYALFTDGSCRIVGKHRRWKAAVWSPTRQVAEAAEGEGESSQFAEVKAIQLALDLAEREKWPTRYLYTVSWMVANALWGWLQQWKRSNWQCRGKPIWAAPLWQDIAAWLEKLLVKVRHVDAHVPKSRATEEHQNNQQVDQAAKIEVAQVDLDWQRKGELFIALWAHDTSGHQGRDATCRWARDQGVDCIMDTISQVIHECETCAAIKQAKRVKPVWYGGRWLKYKYGETQ
ncbi:pol-like protein ENS-3 [Grus japonensis]|uniref:ribonuclease H n=1 Tax=Grus japonensis TaxID=30415 RepID=A0ABC9YHD7_GRUJA